MVNALKMASVDPVTVTMRSGHDESEMLILAPLCKSSIQNVKTSQTKMPQFFTF